jgi:hypothetical protein
LNFQNDCFDYTVYKSGVNVACVMSALEPGFLYLIIKIYYIQAKNGRVRRCCVDWFWGLQKVFKNSSYSFRGRLFTTVNVHIVIKISVQPNE